MTKKRDYLSVVSAILILGFISALLWPHFFIQKTAEIALFFSSRTSKIFNLQQAEALDLSAINFDDNPPISDSSSPETARQKAPDTHDHFLQIPKIGVDGEIIVSESDEALNEGLWHIPGSAFPGEKGNVVIAAHRWLYTPPHPETFYDLDKLKPGDTIMYVYKGVKYTYIVSGFEIVGPKDVRILKQDETKLTLFTCHPLYSTKERYVVTAKLFSSEPI